jgi:hypothetical protein
MELNIGLDGSFDSVLDWKGVLEKQGKLIVRKLLQEMRRLRVQFLEGAVLKQNDLRTDHAYVTLSDITLNIRIVAIFVTVHTPTI